MTLTTTSTTFAYLTEAVTPLADVQRAHLRAVRPLRVARQSHGTTLS
ncbi:MAG: hypothetical protein AVDCRST_MAG10-2598 [uncultured Acidimicrobiales bacterium]|uniref:Uncharacterized protein n=1 Tax=uncultured Acidimicrobiales bacterium TaxID=310071 RepID=A0A6J4IRL4_9ACTN|nr:MAG: hypothetical protein AVDCRST_MAG10-2598 [uncultured Acidimicrobiales bacterium]